MGRRCEDLDGKLKKLFVAELPYRSENERLVGVEPTMVAALPAVQHEVRNLLKQLLMHERLLKEL